MTSTSTSPLTRRSLVAAGVLGAASLATLGSLAPARAADETWTEEFMTRAETREGFLIDGMDRWQIQNARFIIAVVRGHELGKEAACIALSTAIVESWLYNYEPAVDLDSGGLFQQRPSMGWGSAAEVRHKKKAIDAFLGLGDHSEAPGLLQAVPNYRHADPGAAAQTVQASAHPERYAQQVSAALRLWERYADDVEPYTD
ncbi:hypothetical protein [Brachybacterium sp. YJGR34]|uniref:hypothetical protein n=1 Tax=Brachybacterium sp. YJGR34 TaxID=2059911 RepID=UPI000E0CA185|nr:hypothetical protein [Brachybacterium sp. YJGR34]